MYKIINELCFVFRYEIKHAISYNKHKVLELYADVADLSTDNSVER